MKRLVAATLWFVNGWFLGAVAAWVLSVSPVLAPVLALAAGGLVAVDPRQIIWARSIGTSRQFAGQNSN